MAKNDICRGEQCPVKEQCHRFMQWMQAVCDGDVHPNCISKCPSGKWFVRDDKSIHPNHRH